MPASGRRGASLRTDRVACQVPTACRRASIELGAGELPDNTRLNAALENLPPEIRRQILLAADFDGLNALVHASPVFHQQYLLDRRCILYESLKSTLGIVFVDAYTVYQSGQVDFLRTRSTESVTRILEAYKERRSSTTQACSLSTASIISPLARRYTTWTLDNLSKESGTQVSYEPLSKPEETRVTRALYRLQLFSNLFGENHEHPFYPRLRFTWNDVLEILIFLFEPWEVEELHSVYTFAKATYNQIFDEIAWDVDESNPKFDGQRPPMPDGAFDLVNSRTSLLEGTTSRGLQLLHTVLFSIRDHSHLVETMQNNISLGECQLEEYILHETTQYWRQCYLGPSERDLKQERRDPLPFRGDRVPNPDPAGGEILYPPLAWTIIWKGNEDLKMWGYVMWDAWRLESIGAREVLKRQWATYWEEAEDPRNEGRLF
ncbi:hypothetical protein BJX63DRAFT_424024 [Aspergillus granulosus]|uniref:Uncharacterized protein n=1 Tax=Aspergillus granulosus TaxID=176169 RepID=A0ABR4H143_9EURO